MPGPRAPAAAGCLFVRDDTCEFRRVNHRFEMIVSGAERGEVMNCVRWMEDDHRSIGASVRRFSIGTTAFEKGSLATNEHEWSRIKTRKGQIVSRRAETNSYSFVFIRGRRSFPNILRLRKPLCRFDFETDVNGRRRVGQRAD